MAASSRLMAERLRRLLDSTEDKFIPPALLDSHSALTFGSLHNMYRNRAISIGHETMAFPAQASKHLPNSSHLPVPHQRQMTSDRFPALAQPDPVREVGKT